MKHLAVIIPFYQKKSGLLRNAVNSIFFQENIDGLKITIIIVDDQSPTQPDKELLNLESINYINIEIIHQKNAGPAKARNVGLDLADSLNVDYIAFLDSDDTWHSDHIYRALLSLDGISEFYFCDHQRFDDEISYFNVEVDISKFISKHKKNDSLFITIDSGVFFSHLIENYACQTSTIVFSHEILNGLRFDESLTVAGEDYLMWLHLVSKSSYVTMDLKSGVDYGEGVNIFKSSNSWSSPSSIKNNFNQYQLYLKIKAEFVINGFAENFVTTKMEEKFLIFSYLSFKFAFKLNFLGFKLLFSSDLPKVKTLFKMIVNFLNYIKSRMLK